MTETMTVKRGPGRPRKNPLPVAEAATEVAPAPQPVVEESVKPQGCYDRKAAFSGAIIYQVVNHTRDAIRILGPRGSMVAMIYRRSSIPGTNGEIMDHPFAEISARELCEFLNEKAGELR